jgi:two-component sensor histidine kinase
MDHRNPLSARKSSMPVSTSRTLPLLAEFGNAALRGDNIAEITDLAVTCAAAGLGVAKTAILMPGPKAALVARAWVGWDEAMIGRAMLPKDGPSPAARLFRGAAADCYSCERDDRGKDWPEWLISGGIYSVMGAPIEAGPIRYGIIEAAAETTGHFDADGAAFLATLANLLAAAFLRLGHARAGEANTAEPEILGHLFKSIDNDPGVMSILMDRLPFGIAFADSGGTILHANALYNQYAMAEITSDDYVYAKRLSGLRVDAFVEELQLRSAAGQDMWVKVESVPFPDRYDSRIEACSIVTDITKWKSSRLPFRNPDLAHRIRNILSVVRVIARRTAERSLSVEDYAERLESRINALARVQTGMMTDPEAGVDLGMLITDELLAHSIKGNQVTVAGPRIRLWSKAGETFALAIHELIENAIKYGALASKTGQIEITWRIDATAEPARLELAWLEFGVAVVATAPRRRGFGHELIERTLPYELAATTSIDFRPGGIACSVAMPLANRAAMSRFTREEPK